MCKSVKMDVWTCTDFCFLVPSPERNAPGWHGCLSKKPLQQHITLFVGDCVCVGHVCDIYKNMSKLNVLYMYMHIHAEYIYIYIYIMVHLFFV